MEGISIIICCYNSAKRLPATLRHVAMQEVSSNISVEVIVVNNNSTDNTSEVARNEWGKLKSSIPFFIVDEYQPGLSFARKKGIYVARYNYVLFCDDDNWLVSNYVNIAFMLMESNPGIGILGGKIIAVCEINPPEWFEDVKANYAIGLQNKESGDITSRGFVWGAGMVLKKSIYINLEKLGFKTFLSDRKENNLSSGGDAEICMWYIIAGMKLWYDEKLTLNHFIPKERLQIDYFNRLKLGFAESREWNNRYSWLIYVKGLNKNYYQNFRTALITIIKRKKIDKTYLQCLIGPIFKVSDSHDLLFIRRYFRILYYKF